MHRRVVWWLFDRSPEWFQDWVEAWARTLITRRHRNFLPDEAPEQDQDWFWTPEWQAGEREATEQGRRGDT